MGPTTAPDRRPPARRGRGDRGLMVIMTSLLLLPLLTFAAYGIDLASWQSRIGHLQRAADAAALAGTVWMPNLVKAKAVATDALARNDIVHGEDDVVVVMQEGAGPNSLRVTITDRSATQYLSGLIRGDQSLTRRAEAEYYLPLPLGSPLNYFGGDASKTVLGDTTTVTVSWPNPYNSLSRPPAGPFGCNVGTTSGQGLGRWANATSYSATGFSGTTQCTWAPTVTASSPSPSTQLPTNVPCNRLQSPSGSLGRWNTGASGSLPTYAADLRHTGTVSSGNRQCSWSVTGTEPSDAASRPPTNAPCNVTGDVASGSWQVSPSVSFRPLALVSGPACLWTAAISTTVTSHPNPIAADRSPGFWAQVEGPGTVAAYGDAFSTLCTTALSCNAPQSAQWRDSGYWYVVQVPPSGPSPITISVFDAAFRRDGVITGQTGDYNLGASSTTTNPDFVTEYRVYEQTNPLDVTARVPVGVGSRPDQIDGSCWWAVTGEDAFDLRWRPLCTITPEAGSRYLVNVRTSDTGMAHGAGLNGYALQAVATGQQQPRLYAHADMGMFNNGSGTFYLAEVAPHFAGKVLAIDLWDPGDVGSGTGTIYPKMPSLSAPRPVRDAPATCTYTASPDPNVSHSTTAAWGSTGASFATPRASDSTSRCAVHTAPSGTAQRFNDEWLHIRIQIPADYTCTVGLNPETTAGSCWWGIEHVFSSQPYDVTTWKARIEGNPVHLTG